MNDRRHNPRCPPALSCLAALAFFACPAPALAQAPDAAWTALQASYFPGKKLEPAPFIRLTAPTRAASGEQVPFAFNIDHPMTEARYIKSVTLFVDGNPVPQTAVFHFGPQSGKPDIATRIRLESDSPVHVVAEASDGRFYVNAVTVKASGGCSGPATGDEAAARVGAGKMKLALDGPFKAGDVNKASLLIRHPMSTGMQRDLFSHGFRPAYFIDRIAVTYNGKPVLTADTNIGISENPSFRFGFVADKPGVLQIVAHDNEGGTFRQTLDLGG
jgi:sulfur-oxidizing protein SoxY